ncbi:MAG: molybdopterin-dependent oxidoreductase [Acidobacteriia bacterium]|nr:molybdopterin-dependent oxidoreductase [Terriglobia bacterium]
MKLIENVSRRGFLEGTLATGVFILGARLIPGPLWASEGEAAPAPLQPSLWMAIAPDGTVTIVAHRTEMGNGIKTSLPIVLADELGAAWSRVKVEQALGDPKYGDQETDTSHSVRDFFDLMRQTGAAGRLMLIRAAAAHWGVPAAECNTREPHFVRHRPSGRKLGFGELAEAAAKQPVPSREELQLNPRSAWRYIGKENHHLYDLPDMINGKARYGIDQAIAGMVYAAVARPAVLGASVKSHDDTEALKVHGVKQTVVIETFKPPHGHQPMGGVAVIADNTWAAFQGRRKLKVEWDNGSHVGYNSEEFRMTATETARKPGQVIRNLGDVDAAFQKGGTVLEAEYYTPHLAHAPMEPPVAVVDVRDGKAYCWAPTQDPQQLQKTLADLLGIKPEDVICHVTLLGGGFGRKSFQDFVAEGAVLSQKLHKPVKIVWSREDDIRFCYYHPSAAMYLKAMVGSGGKPSAWLQRSVFQGSASTSDAEVLYPGQDEIDNGWTDVPFDIPNHRAESGAARANVRIGWVRSVTNIFHAFGVQSFADELAHAAKKDPVQYQLALIGRDRKIDFSGTKYQNYGASLDQFPYDTARLKRVIEIAAEKSGWGKRSTELGKGHGLGIAAHRSFLTYVATVVEVEVDTRGQVHIPNVWTAVDAGTVVSPDNVRYQMEGAAVFGASLALFGEITATNGAIIQSNFNNYPIARMNRAPRHVEVHIVESEAPPAGVGEPGVPPFAPALCNAVFAATGKRVRELPLSKTKLV